MVGIKKEIKAYWAARYIKKIRRRVAEQFTDDPFACVDDEH